MNKAIISTHRTFIYIIISCIYYYYNYVKKYFYRCKTRPIAWFGEVICLSEYLQLFIYSGKVLTRKGEVPPFHYWNVARKGQWEMVASIPLFFPNPVYLVQVLGSQSTCNCEHEYKVWEYNHLLVSTSLESWSSYFIFHYCVHEMVTSDLRTEEPSN